MCVAQIVVQMFLSGCAVCCRGMVFDWYDKAAQDSVLPVEKTKVGRDFFISNVHYGRCIGNEPTIKLKKKNFKHF